jgi:type II secretory pathway pseudopilin PulG
MVNWGQGERSGTKYTLCEKMKAEHLKKYHGFTLVEVMVVVIITMIVILGAGAVLGGGYKSLNRGFRRVSLQRDASYAMYVFSLPIKEATGATVSDGGSKLTIDNCDTTQTSFFLDSTAKVLKRQKDDNPPQFVIKNVEDLDFVIDSNMVNMININLQLKKDDLLLDFSTTIMMRNFGLDR